MCMYVCIKESNIAKSIIFYSSMSFHGLFNDSDSVATIRSNLKTFHDTFKAVVNGAISYLN